MELFRLAKLVIKGCFLLIGLVLLYEVYEAYTLSKIQPFTIHTDELEYRLFLETFSYQGFEMRDDMGYREASFAPNEIYAYNYQGTRFLIQNQIEGLSSVTDFFTKVYVNPDGWSVAELTSTPDSNGGYIIYSNAYDHWLSWLFTKGEQRVSIQHIAEEYIPSGKWVSDKTLLHPDNGISGETLDQVAFTIYRHSEDYDIYLDRLAEEGIDFSKTQNTTQSNKWSQPSLCAVMYKGEKIMLQSRNDGFEIIHIDSPNQWLLGHSQQSKNNGFELGVIATNENVIFKIDGEHYSIDQIFSDNAKEAKKWLFANTRLYD